MDHGQRLILAEEITCTLLATYGERIAAVAAWGSVAQGADTEHSDLELWAATSEDLPRREIFRVYRGIAVQVSLATAPQVLAEATTVDQYWPLNAARWHAYLALFERSGFFSALRQAASAPRDDDFRRALRSTMRRLHEVGGKLHSSRLRGDRYGLLKAGRDLTYTTAMIIGLANRQFYPNTRELYPLSLEMALQPAGYRQLLDHAGGFTTVEPERVYTAAATLWTNVQHFVRNLGVAWEDSEIII